MTRILFYRMRSATTVINAISCNLFFFQDHSHSIHSIHTYILDDGKLLYIVYTHSLYVMYIYLCSRGGIKICVRPYSDTVPTIYEVNLGAAAAIAIPSN